MRAQLGADGDTQTPHISWGGEKQVFHVEQPQKARDRGASPAWHTWLRTKQGLAPATHSFVPCRDRKLP